MPTIETSKLLPYAEAAIIWDPDSLNVNIGPLLDKVVVKSEQEIQPVKQMGFGNCPIDFVTSGKVGNTIEFTLTRLALAGFLMNFYGSVTGGATGNVEVIVKNKAGQELATEGKKVVIKPLVDGVADSTKSRWFTAYLCTPPREIMDLEYSIGGQQVIKAEMKMLPARTSADYGKLYKFGENT